MKRARALIAVLALPVVRAIHYVSIRQRDAGCSSTLDVVDAIPRAGIKLASVEEVLAHLRPDRIGAGVAISKHHALDHIGQLRDVVLARRHVRAIVAEAHDGMKRNRLSNRLVDGRSLGQDKSNMRKW